MGRPLGSKNKTQEITENVSHETITHTPVMDNKIDSRVRRYSDNRDHKGEGEPLCLGCGHRSDMHYIEHRWTEQKLGKNLQGDIGTIEEMKRRPNYDGARPCQHACLCKQYE